MVHIMPIYIDIDVFMSPRIYNIISAYEIKNRMSRL